MNESICILFSSHCNSTTSALHNDCVHGPAAANNTKSTERVQNPFIPQSKGVTFGDRRLLAGAKSHRATTRSKCSILTAVANKKRETGIRAEFLDFLQADEHGKCRHDQPEQHHAEQSTEGGSDLFMCCDGWWWIWLWCTRHTNVGHLRVHTGIRLSRRYCVSRSSKYRYNEPHATASTPVTMIAVNSSLCPVRFVQLSLR